MKLRIATVMILFIALLFTSTRTISSEGSGWKSLQHGTNSKPSLRLPTTSGAFKFPVSLVSFKKPLQKTIMTEASTTTTTTTTIAPTPTTSIIIVSSPTTTTTQPYVQPSIQPEEVSSPAIVQGGNDATNAFTSNWYRCVIIPESGGNFSDTSGGYGILVSTWNSYGMSGVPGDYSAEIQAGVALQIFASNGGFGPGAWNNPVGCGKSG